MLDFVSLLITTLIRSFPTLSIAPTIIFPMKLSFQDGSRILYYHHDIFLSFSYIDLYIHHWDQAIEDKNYFPLIISFLLLEVERNEMHNNCHFEFRSPVGNSNINGDEQVKFVFNYPTTL